MRRDKDQKVMKTPVNAARLEVYPSPINRPDYLVDENMESEDELDDNDDDIQTTPTSQQSQLNGSQRMPHHNDQRESILEMLVTTKGHNHS